MNCNKYRYLSIENILTDMQFQTRTRPVATSSGRQFPPWNRWLVGLVRNASYPGVFWHTCQRWRPGWITWRTHPRPSDCGETIVDCRAHVQDHCTNSHHMRRCTLLYTVISVLESSLGLIANINVPDAYCRIALKSYFSYFYSSF